MEKPSSNQANQIPSRETESNFSQVQIPDCQCKNQAKYLCQTPTCKLSPFICEAEQCKQCESKHQFCLKVNIKPLIKILSKKREKKDNKLTKYVQQITDKLIDQISQFRDNLLQHLQYLGLNSYEEQFMAAMQLKAYQNVKSQTIHQICKTAHIKETIFTQNALQYVKYKWQKESSNVKQLLHNLQDSIFKSFKKPPIIKEFDSKIVQNETVNDLFEMFGQSEKISRMNLLYRGSESNFSIDEFRKKCNQRKNNLCLIKTQAGNIIGAFTPLVWSSEFNNQYVNDPSMKTFLFSLTLKVKLVQRNGGNQTTHHYTNWGPRYGVDGSCDLAIGENGNNNSSNCYANICNLFMPQKAEDQDKIESIKQKFIGNSIRGTSKFKMTEWQMFEVQFD